MSAGSPPAAASPSKRREGGAWPESQPSYFESSAYGRGPPPPGPGPGAYYRGPSHGPHGPPPPPHHDYRSQEPPRGPGGPPAYWGNPPPYEAGYSPNAERRMPPPARVPRGPARPYLTIGEEQQSPAGPHRRVPGSPSSPYSSPYHSRGPLSLQPKREYQRHPPRMGEGYPRDQVNVPKDKKTGDPLSILANVSAGMTGKDKQKQKHMQQNVSIPPAPTSPLQRRIRPNAVITPSQSSPESAKQRQPRRQITPNSGSNSNINRTPEHSAQGQPYWERHEHQHYMDSPPMPYYPPRRRPPYSEYGPPPHESPPALVERGSFDSDSPHHYYHQRHRDGPFPPPPATPPGPGYYYDDHPPPPYGAPGYWDGPPRGAPYPPPRGWNYGGPPPPPHPYPVDHYPEYPYDGRPEDDSFPPHHHSHQPPPHHHAAPYTYVQLPRLEEKTVLRKKFSWKHYPELERFLIANRDEYLKHSSMNYTAEQKQYNNWLTEQLLEVAGKNHYVFDPDDFSFVAIRDRIRCYYKSYVQTARKRGLKLPEKKKG